MTVDNTQNDAAVPATEQNTDVTRGGREEAGDGNVRLNSPAAKHDKSRWWKEGAVAGILAVYSFVFLLVLFLAWQGGVLGVLGVDGVRASFLQTAIYVLCAGGLGSTTYCIRAFYYYTIKDDFLFETYFWWYVFRPLSGIILAVAAFALTKGGVVVFGGSSASTSASNYALFGMAYLAGFGTEQVLERLRVASKAVFGIEKSLGEKRFRTEENGGGETTEEVEHH